VSGYDLNNTLVKSLKGDIDPNNEVSQQDLASAHELSFHNDIKNLKGCNVYIVCVPTPVDQNKVPNLTHLIKACKDIAPYVNNDDVVVFESTVYPGATEKICIPILEEISGKTCLTDNLAKTSNIFHVGYSPERINPGDKDRNISDITKVTSGSSQTSQIIIKKIYNKIIKAGVHNAGAIKVAEAAKVLENIQRDVNIALMNEFSNLCNKIGIDTQEVIRAAKTKWNFLHFTPGLVGGHCIGVDPYYLTDLAHRENCDVDLIRTARLINEAFPVKVAQRILSKLLENEILPNKAKILICGVTFKENVTDIRNSKVKELIDELVRWNIHVSVHDPNLPISIIRENFSENIIQDLNKNNFDAIVFAVGHEQFKAISSLTIQNLCLGRQKLIIFDLKSILDKRTFSNDELEILTL